MKHRMVTPQSALGVVMGLVLLLGLSGCGFYKKMQANKKNTEVETSLAELRAQQAERYLPEDFESLSRLLSEARSAVDTGEYDLALQKGEDAMGLVPQLQSKLSQAKAVVEQKRAGLVDLQTRITDVVEQVKVIAPVETDLVSAAGEVDTLIDTIQNAPQQVSEGEQGYDAGLTQAKAFLDRATATLGQLERESAQKLLTGIEDAWTEATVLEVTKYVPESQEIPAQIEQAKALIEAGSFRAVLDRLGSLPDKIGRFRERAREKRAAARIEQAERLIALAESNPEASLDAVEQAKKSSREASDALQEGNYDSAFSSAEAAITAARKEVQAIEDDLRSQVDELEARIEQSLDWETARIASELYNQAVGLLDKAKENLTEILFDQCQEAIDRGAQVIEEAIAEARIEGLNRRIEKDEKDLLASQEIGAFQYLREDYQAIQGLLEDARKLISRASFDEAEEVLKEAEEKTVGLETGLRDLAQTQLATAETSYKKALEAEAEIHAADVLEEAVKNLESARAAAAAARWKEAVETGQASEEKSKMAAQQAFKIRTENLKPSAEEEVQYAKEAGASAYAAEIYNKALSANANSQVAFEGQRYQEAMERLTETRDLAVKARLHRIDLAQNSVDSAIEAKADEYETDLLGQALSNLSESRAKMDDGDYPSSGNLAENAKKQAQEAEANTWRKRATQAIADLEREVSEAQSNRAPTYAEAEYKKVEVSLEQAQGKASAEDFKAAFLAADQGKQEMENVNTRLTDESRLVRGDYDRMIGLLKSYVEDDFGTGLHLQATERLGRIDDAILRNDFETIFGLYEEGSREVENQIVAVKLHNINAKKTEIESKIAKADSSGLFSFVDKKRSDVESELAGVEYDPVLDRLKTDVDYYAETVRGLALVRDEIDRLEGAAQGNIENRIQRVRTDIDNSSKIGARDLVPAVFDSAVDNYEKARDMIYLLSNEITGEREVTYKEVGAQLAAAESQSTQLNQSAITKNSSVNYLRDLVFWTFDMTRFLDQWYPIEEMGYEMILTSAPTTIVDSYAEMQVGISSRDLLREAERLFKRIRPITPPNPQIEVHAMALASFELFSRCADGFYRFGQYTRYPERVRERFLAQAFQDLERLHQLNDSLVMAIIKQVKAYDLEGFEREYADEFSAFRTYLRRDKTTR